jgi:hypothetical protein
MKKFICTLTLIAATTPVFAQALVPVANTAVVKKTDKNVCHAPGTQYYSRIKHFQSYKTLDECLKSGGKVMPKK